jgi:hypothetical protein
MTPLGRLGTGLVYIVQREDNVLFRCSARVEHLSLYCSGFGYGIEYE